MPALKSEKQAKNEALLHDQTNLLPRKQLLIVFATMASAFLVAYADQNGIAVALPTMAKDLGAADTIAWAGTSSMIANTLFQVLYGRLSDIFGRKGKHNYYFPLRFPVCRLLTCSRMHHCVTHARSLTCISYLPLGGLPARCRRYSLRHRSQRNDALYRPWSRRRCYRRRQLPDDDDCLRHRFVARTRPLSGDLGELHRSWEYHRTLPVSRVYPELEDQLERIFLPDRSSHGLLGDRLFLPAPANTDAKRSSSSEGSPCRLVGTPYWDRGHCASPHSGLWRRIIFPMGLTTCDLNAVHRRSCNSGFPFG